MKKIRIFHLPVFVIILLCGISAAVLHITTPKPILDHTLLPEYALALEDGQFICEDGSIWRMRRDSRNGDVNLTRISEVDHRLFTDIRKASHASELLPYEYAMATETKRLIFLRNDGSVWLATDDVIYPDKTLVIPFYIIPSPQLDVSYEEILITPEGNDTAIIANRLKSYHRYYVYLESTRYALDNFSAYLSVELKDGRYYLSESADLVRWNNEPLLWQFFLPTSEQLHRASIPGNYTIEFCYFDRVVSEVQRTSY